MIVQSVVIPAAGHGKRFAPASNAVPKEMFPIVDKPAIQYIAEEALGSGVRNLTFITNTHKSAIGQHFAMQPRELSCTYIHQLHPHGLGHAVWLARNAIHDDYFGIMLPDEIIVGNSPCMAQLCKVAMQEKCNVIAVAEVPLDDTPSYGIIEVKRQFSPTLFQVKDVIEKPTTHNAPSNLAIVGRYILSKKIFSALDDLAFGMHNEIQLTDGIRELIHNGEKIFAVKISHNRYDVGNPLGWLKANIALGLSHAKHGSDLQSYLTELDKELMVLQGKMQLKRAARTVSL